MSIEEETIDKYLGANRPDVVGLEDFNLTHYEPKELDRQFAEALALRRRLAPLGPAVVPTMLRIALTRMQIAAELARTPIAQLLNPEGYGEIAAGLTEAIFKNAEDLVSEIGEQATEPLIEALKEQDPDIRALAASFLGLKRLSSHRIVAPLQNVVAEDEDALVKYAAVTSLIDCEFVDRKTVKELRKELEAWINRIVPEWSSFATSLQEMYRKMLPQHIAARDQW